MAARKRGFCAAEVPHGQQTKLSKVIETQKLQHFAEAAMKVAEEQKLQLLAETTVKVTEAQELQHLTKAAVNGDRGAEAAALGWGSGEGDRGVEAAALGRGSSEGDRGAELQHLAGVAAKDKLCQNRLGKLLPAEANRPIASLKSYTVRAPPWCEAGLQRKHSPLSHGAVQLLPERISDQGRQRQQSLVTTVNLFCPLADSGNPRHLSAFIPG